MGKIIYWEEYDEPIKYTDPVNGKEYEKKGDYVCNDERVEKYVVWGYLKNALPNSEMGIQAGLFMKDGTREQFIPTIESAAQWEENLIQQAEHYLNTLK